MHVPYEIYIGSFVAVGLVLILKLSHLTRIGTDLTALDSEFHLMLIKRIKENNHNPFNLHDKRFLIQPTFYYPPLLHWLLSFFKFDYVIRYQSYIPIFFKSLIVFVIGLITGLIIKGTTALDSDIYAGSAALLAGIAYGVSPMNRCNYWWAMYDYQLSPRSLGMLLTICLQAFYLAYIMSGSYWWVLMCSSIFAGTCLASRFALQAQIFLLLGLFIIQKSLIPFYILTSGILLATILSRGFFIQLGVVHFRHLYTYATRIAFEHPDTQFTSSLTSWNIFRFPYYILKFRYDNLIDLVQRDVVARAFVFYPVHIVTTLFIIKEWQVILENPTYRLLATFWGIALISFIATSFKYTKFLGEADRYMEFAGIFPSTLLFVILGLNNEINQLIFALTLCMVSGWYFVLQNYLPNQYFKKSNEHTKLDKFLETLDPVTCTFVSVPCNHARPLAYRHGFKLMHYVNISDRKMYDKYIHSYPIPKLDATLLDEHRVTHILVQKNFIDNSYVDNMLKTHHPVYKSNTHIVFSTNRDNST
ncbi:MAG: hypothetical protein HN675_05070 [Opitutae bacterium]|nr:hypothetical protein [Opitutae bacterium]MBT7852671.1 hypothetical protein [Opitutae bacterium]